MTETIANETIETLSETALERQVFAEEQEASVDSSTTSHRLKSRGIASQAGMTLLEIMIVLAIIATVMGLLFGPAIFGALGDSKIKTTRIILGQYNQAYVRWATNTGDSCPGNLTDLKKYVASDDVVDSWKKELKMVCGSGGELPEGTPFGVVSSGEDGKFGTDDDLKSWEKRSKAEK